MTWDYGILPWYHVHWAKLLDGYVDKYEKVGVFLRFRGSCCVSLRSSVAHLVFVTHESVCAGFTDCASSYAADCSIRESEHGKTEEIRAAREVSAATP